MRIDSHVYFSSDHPPAHLAAILARNRFEGAILVADELLPIEPPIAGVIVRQPRSLEECRKHPGFRGVALSLQSGIPPLVAELASFQIPLDLEMRPADFPAVLALAAEYPSLRIAIDHMARPDFGAPLSDEWARGMEHAARFPQVYCKISGLLTASIHLPWSAAPIRPFVQHVLAAFGPDRLMFGSEWPKRLPDVIWKESLAAFTQSIGAQSQETRERLLGGTAEEFYRL